MNYQESLEYLSSLLKFGIKPELDRFARMCEIAGNPQDKLRVVHITGTNGKGSTATFVSHILRAAGFGVGTYLSPYVHDVRERVQINGEMISREDFAGLITEIRPIIESLKETEFGQATEFEAKTLLAFMNFARSKPDFCAIEVGMGGTWDCTNLVKPMATVITNVSLDHTERLGNTVAKIARDKAGIAKPGAPMITAAEDEEAWREIYDVCRSKGVDVWRVLRDDFVVQSDSPVPDKTIRYSVCNRLLDIDLPERPLRNLKVGLSGDFQYANAATAAAAVYAQTLQEVDVPDEAFINGIADAYIPGRLEVLRKNPTVIIDGAHNPGAAEHLADTIRKEYAGKRIILVVGMLSTHSSQGFMEKIAHVADTIIATAPPWHLAAPAESVAEQAAKHLPEDKIITAEPVMEAVDEAISMAGPDDVVLITGSFYTIGEVTVE